MFCFQGLLYTFRICGLKFCFWKGKLLKNCFFHILYNCPPEICLLYECKVNISRLTLRETRDKRPLRRDPDKSWCHGHTSVKLFWSRSMMEPWATTKTALHLCVAVTPAAFWIPTQRPIVPSFTTVIDNSGNFSPSPRISTFVI